MACDPTNNGPPLIACCPPGCPQNDPNYGELRYEIFDQPLGGPFDVGWLRSNEVAPVSHWKFTLTRKTRIVNTRPSPFKCDDGITDYNPPGTDCVGAQSCRASASFQWFHDAREFGGFSLIQGQCSTPGDFNCVVPCSEEDNPSSGIFYAQFSRCYMLRIAGGPANPACVPRDYFGCVLEAINVGSPFLIAEWVIGPIPPP